MIGLTFLFNLEACATALLLLGSLATNTALPSLKLTLICDGVGAFTSSVTPCALAKDDCAGFSPTLTSLLTNSSWNKGTSSALYAVLKISCALSATSLGTVF